jgi:hypothetical protein
LYGGRGPRRADNPAGTRQAAVRLDFSRQTEVGEMHAVAGIDQHVGRFQVTVQHAFLVNKVNCFGDFFHVTRRPSR